MVVQSYRAIVRSLPQPSFEQTIRFAWFVSAARSWYKHLPEKRTVPFVFFLDPNAGRNLILTRTGERERFAILRPNHDTSITPGRLRSVSAAIRTLELPCTIRLDIPVFQRRWHSKYSTSISTDPE